MPSCEEPFCWSVSDRTWRLGGKSLCREHWRAAFGIKAPVSCMDDPEDPTTIEDAHCWWIHVAGEAA